MPANNGYISCCPRCAQLFQSVRGDTCPTCGFRPAAITSTTWDEYLQIGEASYQSQAALDTLIRIRNRIKNGYARSSPYYNAQYEQMQEDRESALAQQQAYVPRCPTCGSPDIVNEPHYLGWGNRTTFRCCNCNYKW